MLNRHTIVVIDVEWNENIKEIDEWAMWETVKVVCGGPHIKLNSLTFNDYEELVHGSEESSRKQASPETLTPEEREMVARQWIAEQGLDVIMSSAGRFGAGQGAGTVTSPTRIRDVLTYGDWFHVPNFSGAEFEAVSSHAGDANTVTVGSVDQTVPLPIETPRKGFRGYDALRDKAKAYLRIPGATQAQAHGKSGGKAPK